MARPNRLVELEARHGDLHKLIPPLVNERGQVGAALELGVSQGTISTWLRANGYSLRTEYVRNQGTPKRQKAS